MNGLTTSPKGLTLEGEALVEPHPFGRGQRLLVGPHDFMESICDRFYVAASKRLGKLRITVEILDED